MESKFIEVRNGTKTTYKIADNVSDDSLSCKDIGANGGSLALGLPKDKFDKIFGDKSNGE